MERSLVLAALLALFACNEDDDVYSVSDCEADGGTVVSSIGDGMLMCPSGSSSLGPVTTEEGKPAAEEGAICCAT